VKILGLISSFFFVEPQKEYLAAFAHRPLWLNWLLWNIRNPFPGIGLYWSTDKMEGVSDWNPKGGWWLLRHKSGLPFVSYRGKYAEFYFGWRPNGAFGIALRHANAKGY
jgi:hypothetical protein